MKTYQITKPRQAFSKDLNGQRDYITLIRSDVSPERAYDVFTLWYR